MTKSDRRIILIEGYEAEDGVRIRYELPKITTDAIADFYRTFIVELCKKIGQLEGAEKLMGGLEEESVEEI